MEKELVLKDSNFILDKKELIKSGENEIIYNNFFNLIDYIMNDDMTRLFIEEYFKDWDEIKTSLMFIKTYQIVDKEIHNLERKNNKKFEKDERRKMIIALIKNLISNSESRKEIVKNMCVFMDSDFNTTKKICQKMIEKN
jgi:hypothetical protein